MKNISIFSLATSIIIKNLNNLLIVLESCILYILPENNVVFKSDNKVKKNKKNNTNTNTNT